MGLWRPDSGLSRPGTGLWRPGSGLLELFRLDSVLWRPGLGVMDRWTAISMYAYVDRWTKHPVF